MAKLSAPVPKRWLAAIFTLVAFPVLVVALEIQTPLEASDYSTLPQTDQVNGYLEDLAQGSALARREVIGRSSQHKPIVALFISNDPAFLRSPIPRAPKLSVLLIGGQHGTEPAGGEALQVIARELLSGDPHGYLETMNFAIVPISNPDGRDAHRRVNAQGINLSTDFIIQSQAETQALVRLLSAFAPHVLLDIHESAILKKKSLGKQGFMTDFEAQFEVSNNPNVSSLLRKFTLEVLLPQVLDNVMAKGTRATRYVNEITDINQTITHGGATLRNFRNYSGFRGVVSMLLENRLDPPGDYPTPRNIRVRIEKQYDGVTGFLDTLVNNRNEILATVMATHLHSRWRPGQSAMALAFKYVSVPEQPTISLTLTELASGEKQRRTFTYASEVETTLAELLPSYYAIRREQDRFAALLTRHGIDFSRLGAPRSVTARTLTIDRVHSRPKGGGKTGKVLEVDATPATRRITLAPGDLWVDLTQPLGALVPLILDPRSSNTVFLDARYTGLLLEGKEHLGIAVP